MQILRVFLGLTVVMLLFLCTYFTPNISAESGQTYHVGTSQLNVRTAPSSTSEIIGNLGYGNRVVVFKEVHGWAQTYYAGQKAWVASHFLYGGNENQQEASPAATKITITTDHVRIRTGPGTENAIIDSTNSGISYNLIDSKNNWHKISLADGTTGWVADWLTDTKLPKESIQEKRTKPSNESI